MKTSLKNLLALTTVAVFVASCSQKKSTENIIVGKWQMNYGNKEIYQFQKDGTVTDEVPEGAKMAGKYTLADDDHVKCDFDGLVVTFRFSISGNELNLIDSDGKTNKYNRAN